MNLRPMNEIVYFHGCTVFKLSEVWKCDEVVMMRCGSVRIFEVVVMR